MVKVGFSTTNKWLSRAIRYLTKSDVSHAFIVYDSITLGQPMVMEAVGKGFTSIPYSKLLKHSTVVELVDLGPAGAGLPAAVADRLGDSYDKAALVGNLFVMIAAFFRRKIRNPWNSTRSVYCTEVIAEGLKEIGWAGADSLDPSTTNPKKLREFLKNACS